MSRPALFPQALQSELGATAAVCTKGRLEVDAGCAAAVLKKKNLYAPGITNVGGVFGRLDAVTVVSPDGVELARGLVNYSSQVRTSLLYWGWLVETKLSAFR